MQYILTADEYAELLNKADRTEVIEQEKVLDLCQMVAKYKPVTVIWRGENAEPEPWGCIMDEESDPGYCDECPVQDWCPYEHKKWSK